jgi:hypothetical protein
MNIGTESMAEAGRNFGTARKQKNENDLIVTGIIFFCVLNFRRN